MSTTLWIVTAYAAIGSIWIAYILLAARKRTTKHNRSVTESPNHPRTFRSKRGNIMTKIENFADLLEIPIGRQIVDKSSGTNKIWNRVEGGWEWSGTTIRDKSFEWAVSEGHVTRHIAPVPDVGRVWINEGDSANYYWMVKEVQVDGEEYDRTVKVTAVVFNTSWQFSKMVDEGGFGATTNWGNENDMNSGARALGNQLYSSLEESRRIRRDMQAALHAYLDANDYPENSDLERILVDHGLEKRYSDVEVTLDITGQVSREVPVPGDAVEGLAAATMTMLLPFGITRSVVVKAPGCGCKVVTSEQVKDLIGFEVESFAWTASCDMDDKKDDKKKKAAKAA